ncbi:hypothetical protein FOMPIDRAFT_125581 [Fomitopsis schrenkii]|uniref:Anaphase-promoting complex subunit 4 n=1 Tax=Fomitopsis schrenkii TaxID=2126942 RepID=S8EGS9_FOMSC|nr:hypothetical protein FOMPIDRAFT_125581 [Fomitopsis schrenkii]
MALNHTSATDLFAFKQKPARGIASNQPAVIASWPTLPSDLLAASIQSAKLGAQRPRPGEDLDEADLTNMDSVLAVADDAGHLHCFLDGSYPLGIIASMAPCIASMSLAKDNDLLFAHPRFTDPKMTSLRPAVIHLPYLRRRALRDVARVSSSVRELVWYAMRVIKDMRAAWFGGEAQSGARELGPKWIRALETRMKDEFGQDEPYAMLDLTNLLATGRASEPLADFLGSGEQMTERGMQKWEQSMIESLVMLRDYSEKRVAPACQRLHLLLEEVYGWSLLPQYQLYGINTVQVTACMDLAGRAVLLAGWLAATARRELVRFTEFMFWLRYETTRLNTSGEGHNHPPAPRHDILEVNDYLMSGLVVSPIDRWFMGPVPQFSPHDLGVPGDWTDMKSTAQRARRVLKEPRLCAWQYNIKQKDLSHLDRNLDSLVQELATRAHRIFFEAANATARSAVLRSKVNVNPDYFAENTTLLRAVESNSSALIRERTVLEPGQAANYTQFLLIQLPRVADRSYLCIARLHHGTDTIQRPVEAEVALMECCIPVNDASETKVPLEVLDAEFFDDSVFIIVYREAMQPEFASIATVGYGDLIYTPIELTGMAGYARETLMQEVLNRLECEQLSSEAAPLIQTRRLTGCREGKVALAVNGRTGRRVACVLDASPDDNGSRLSEAALRKKKNADAQAAFRARRANYIATLEQTVTNLETVVLQLQDSCKGAKSDNENLRREVERWKQATRHAERTARKLWQAQQRGGMIANGQSHEYNSLHAQSAVGPPPMSPGLMAHYGDNGMRYPSNGDQSVSLGGAFQHAGMAQDVQRSPTGYSQAVAADGSSDGRSQHMDSHRMHGYDRYYAMSNGTGHDGGWPHNGQASVSPSDVLDSGSSSHSPSYVESPTLTSPELAYPQYMDEKTDILDSPSYVFSNTDSRSISPAISTPTSTSSASSIANAPFPFTFQSEPMMQDRTEFGYRRSGPGPQLTLHGGTADITVAPPRRDGSRYGVAPRIPNPLTDRPITQALAAYSRSENGSGGRDRDSDNESNSYGYSRSRGRSEAPSAHGSRSPSPIPPVCGTLAVIKAQAFGALRRTRTKGKKTTESAARAAVEALEARGIEMGIAVGSKRPRLHDDSDTQS